MCVRAVRAFVTFATTAPRFLRDTMSGQKSGFPNFPHACCLKSHWGRVRPWIMQRSNRDTASALHVAQAPGADEGKGEKAKRPPLQAMHHPNSLSLLTPDPPSSTDISGNTRFTWFLGQGQAVEESLLCT